MNIISTIFGSVKNPLIAGKRAIFILILFVLSGNVYSIGIPSQLLGTVNTSENNDPKLLSDFGEGCYGLDQTDLTPILQEERNPIVGFFYLVKNPDYTEGSVLSQYNVVLCKKRKISPEDQLKYLSFSAFFPQSSESIAKGESYDTYFKKTVSVNIKNSFNGNFSVKTTPNFTILFKSPSLVFEKNDKKYNLSNITFSLRSNISYSISTPSIQISLLEDPRPKKPRFVDHNKKKGVQKQKCEIIGVPGYEKMFCHKELELRSSVDEQLVYKFEAESLAPEAQRKKVIITANAITLPGSGDDDEICYGINGVPNAPLSKYLDFDVHTGVLSQKLDTVMPEGMKCIVNVTANDTSDFTTSLSSLSFHADSGNILDGVTVSSSTTQKVSIVSFVPKLTTVEVGTPDLWSSTPSPSVVTTRHSGGGSHIDTVNRLRQVGLTSPHSSSNKKNTVLKCPEKTYVRYPDQRGFGVSLDLFPDANPNHRAYSSLIDLAEQRIVNRDNMSGKARLDSFVSRAEFVKIMTIAREDTLLLGDCLKLSHFKDVLPDDWFTPFVQNLEARSIVRGYKGNVYKPEQKINLVEAYKVIALSFHYITLEKAEKIAHDRGVEWYVPYVEVLENSGVIPSWLLGVDKKTFLTRGDVFVILSRVLLQKDWLKNLNW